MASHRFDPVSLVFGALAIASGIVVLAGRSLAEDARVLVPAGLMALGIALLVKITGQRVAPVPPPPAAEGLGLPPTVGGESGESSEGPVDRDEGPVDRDDGPGPGQAPWWSS